LTLAICLAFPVSVLSAPFQDPSQQFDVFEATIPELQDAMAEGRVTAAELVDAYLARIEAYDQSGPSLNSIIRLNPNARVEAEALDRERAAQGPRGLLHGIPIILKDNYDTKDLPTTAGSIALAGLVPPDDAFQVRRLREAGAIILGKSNLHELAMGITTVSSLGGQTLNPYELSRNPGGSSGGTGAAVAASFVAIGWGSDTCGSIRGPAAQNNLFGLRPTKGLSSIDGIIPLCHTQDVAGPLARTAIDLAIGLDATIGPDPADPATQALDSVPLPRFVESLDSTALDGARLGVLTLLFGDATEDREADRVVRAALEQMRELGAEIFEVEIPGLDSLLRGSSVIAYEFKFDFIDYLAATPGAPIGSLQHVLDGGLYHEALESRYRARNRVEQRDSEEYRAALAKRDAVHNAVIGKLTEESLDALVYPTLRRKASRIGDPQRGSNCQLSASSGLPALSVPVGFTEDGLPIGLELLGMPFDDARLLALGYSFEQANHPRRPPMNTPALVAGRAPDSIVYEVVATGVGGEATGRFVYDVTSGVLTYDVTVSGTPAAQVYSVSLHRAGDEGVGPVVHRLLGLGQATASGVLTLAQVDRAALVEGRLYLSLYTSTHPGGTARGGLVIP
jgi:Asp-tRNA(Asn)/Glu-tRNA(Gln) amidotransferase A subunit family amidase